MELEVFEALARRAVSQKRDFNSREVGQLLFAFAHLEGSALTGPLFEEFSSQAVAQADAASAADIAHTLSAFAMVNVHHPRVCEKLGGRLVLLHDKLKPYEAAMAFHAMCSMWEAFGAVAQPLSQVLPRGSL